MDTKDTAEKTAPSAAPAEPAPKPRHGEPEPEEPVPSVHSSALEDNSLQGLGVAFSVLSVGAPVGKANAKAAVDMGAEEEDTGDDHNPSGEVPFDDKPSESAPSASDHPPSPSSTTTTHPATQPARSSALKRYPGFHGP